jgi:thiol-disulfide isomerase/thioredoxin
MPLLLHPFRKSLSVATLIGFCVLLPGTPPAEAQGRSTTPSQSDAAAGNSRAKKTAYDFTYRDINPRSETHGQLVSLHEFNSERGMVLNFLASWCPPCWAELPYFEKLEARGGLPVVCIAADERGDKSDVLNKAEQAGLTLPLLLVPADEIELMERHYTHLLLPTTYWIAGDGEILGNKEGSMNERLLFSRTDKLLPATED